MYNDRKEISDCLRMGEQKGMERRDYQESQRTFWDNDVFNYLDRDDVFTQVDMCQKNVSTCML